VNDEFGDVFGTIISLTAGTREDGAPEVDYAELKTIAEQARDRLLQLEDVAKVDLYGVQDERIFVEYDNSRLAELGLSVVQLQHALESRNIVLPGGNITTAVERLELEPSGNFDDRDDIRRTVFGAPGRSEFLWLVDSAGVRRGGLDPPRRGLRANGLPALGVGGAGGAEGCVV
jgi:multidrug efflux pump subunit AcrB